jgi:UDP-N-acetylmuramoyl-tripeptide--D-alanyl-D-alanine ligase
VKKLRLKDILPHIKGEVVQGKITEEIQHVTVDPADIRQHTLYFDLSAPYKWKSLPVKESVVIVTESPSRFIPYVNGRITIVSVRRTEHAYWKFVRFYRSLFQIPVIGVTGTSGKTTTTEMLKAILSRQFRVQSTYDGKNSLSYNLPYLLGIDESTEAAVLEMGVSHPGCIENSCKYFRPQVGIILNIGVYHLLGCGTFDKYLTAKAEMVQGIAPNGTLILNADDEHIAKIDLSSFAGKVVYFGRSERCHFRALNVKYADGGMTFVLQFENHFYPLFVAGYGEHNVFNALAALAAAHAVGMDIAETGKGLSSFEPVRAHLEFRPGPRGSTIINDTWNCTPPSMASALHVLHETAERRKKIAVLGYMPQLGENGTEEYDSMAEKVLGEGVDQLVVIGEAQRIGRKAIQLGMNKQRVHFCESGEEVYQALRPFLDPGSLILFKFPYKYRMFKMGSFRKLMNGMWE